MVATETWARIWHEQGGLLCCSVQIYRSDLSFCWSYGLSFALWIGLFFCGHRHVRVPLEKGACYKVRPVVMISPQETALRGLWACLALIRDSWALSSLPTTVLL
jgi:hypothetical protein